MRKVAKLCKMKQLKPPGGFVKKHSYHYGKYENNKLVSILSISVMKMNNMPGSIAVSIDIAASVDKCPVVSGVKMGPSAYTNDTVPSPGCVLQGLRPW